MRTITKLISAAVALLAMPALADLPVGSKAPPFVTSTAEAGKAGRFSLATALKRFDRDVLSIPNAAYMTVLEGINDIGMNRASNPPTPEQIIAGYRQIIDRAHAHGIKVYGATLMAFEGASYYSEAGEVTRQAVNVWIRTGGGFDGVIDFDAVMKDPANPKRLKANLQSGDWLHPNDDGYKVMADSIDLKLFR